MKKRKPAGQTSQASLINRMFKQVAFLLKPSPAMTLDYKKAYIEQFHEKYSGSRDYVYLTKNLQNDLHKRTIHVAKAQKGSGKVVRGKTNRAKYSL